MIPFNFLLGTSQRYVTRNQSGNIGADTTEPDPGSKSPQHKRIQLVRFHSITIESRGVVCPWNVRSSFLPSPVIVSPDLRAEIWIEKGGVICSRGRFEIRFASWVLGDSVC